MTSAFLPPLFLRSAQVFGAVFLLSFGSLSAAQNITLVPSTSLTTAFFSPANTESEPGVFLQYAPSLSSAVPNEWLDQTPPTEADFTPKISTVWERIRQGFAIPDLKNDLVTHKEAFYVSKPDYVQRMAERAGRYLYFIVEEVERRGMPTEIALLPFIESAFNPQAMSSAKASGMWQFIPGTGKHFGLKQTAFRDERRDVIESTHAALDYLSKLHDMFGDWHLALAAYNWGEGSVARAMSKNERAGLPTNYVNLKMPLETQQYVPKLQAIKNIVAAPEMFGLSLPEIENEQYFTTITKTRDIDVQTAAKFAGMSVEEFRKLNPSFNKPVIIGATQPQIVLPVDKAQQFQDNLNNASGSLSSYSAYKLASRETLDQIGKRFGTSAEELRQMNGIPHGMRVKVGATLLVPKPRHIDKEIPEAIAENAVLVFEPEQAATKRVKIKTRKGDTLASVAKRYRVSVAQLRGWNRGAPEKFKAGQTLAVQMPVKNKNLAKTPTRKRDNVKLAQRR